MRTELLRERYEPLEVVGRGGEGEVIRALDHLHGRQVALKVRPAADEASRSRSALRGAAPALALAASGAPAGPRGLLRGRPLRDRDGLDRGHGPRGVARRRRPSRARPGARDRLPRAGRRGARAPAHARPARRPRRRQAGQPDPHLLRPGRPRRLRAVLHADRRAAPGGHGRLRGARGRGRRETDRGVGRVLVRRDRRWRCSPASLPPGARRAGARSSRERIPALERIVRANLATDPARRDASAAAFVARLQRWWGAALPTGTVTLVLADVSARAPRIRSTTSPARTAATASRRSTTGR